MRSRWLSKPRPHRNGQRVEVLQTGRWTFDRLAVPRTGGLLDQDRKPIQARRAFAVRGILPGSPMRPRRLTPVIALFGLLSLLGAFALAVH